MSHGQAKPRVQKMKTDEAFRAKVLATADPAARTQLIHAQDFACSADEIAAVSTELSDSELDLVSGGTGIMIVGGQPTVDVETSDCFSR